MKIAAYVMDKYAKQTYSSECHDVRAWPGFEVVLHAVRAAGYSVEYAGMATAHKFDVVLVSITSDCDWWPFVAERAKWNHGSQLVVAGGAGVLNIRPFRSSVDVFAMGRSERLIVDIIKAYEKGDRCERSSVIWSDSFSHENTYTIEQTDEPYPHRVIMTNGKPFQETAIGCPNKCLFCGYTWHRKYIGDGTFRAGADAMSSGNTERTIIDLLKLSPDHWQDEGPLRMVGLDGMSERLRKKVNKPITRDMWRAFLSGLSQMPKPHQVKVYCIIGYPDETEDDWSEFVEDIKIVDQELPKSEKQWSILLHITPFRAMPATPCAGWQMSLQNYRGVMANHLKNKGMPGNVFYQGNAFWAVESMGTESLPTVVHSALCHRGTESNADDMIRIAMSKRYWSAPQRRKTATLQKMFDLDVLFGKFTPDKLPTKYLPCRKWNA